MLQKIQLLDQRITLFMRDHRFSPKVNGWLRFYVRLGDGYIWALFALLMIYILGWKGFLTVLWQSLDSLAVSLTLYWVVKLSVKRARPFSFFEHINAEVPPLDKYSFPSGHTMNNLAVACTVFFLVPQVGWVMLLLPVTWGILRIYFGVHWASDIVAGIFLGGISFLIGHFLWNLFIRL